MEYFHYPFLLFLCKLNKKFGFKMRTKLSLFYSNLSRYIGMYWDKTEYRSLYINIFEST